MRPQEEQFAQARGLQAAQRAAREEEERRQGAAAAQDSLFGAGIGGFFTRLFSAKRRTGSKDLEQGGAGAATSSSQQRQLGHAQRSGVSATQGQDDDDDHEHRTLSRGPSFFARLLGGSGAVKPQPARGLGPSTSFDRSAHSARGAAGAGGGGGQGGYAYPYPEAQDDEESVSSADIDQRRTGGMEDGFSMGRCVVVTTGGARGLVACTCMPYRNGWSRPDTPVPLFPDFSLLHAHILICPLIHLHPLFFPGTTRS